MIEIHVITFIFLILLAIAIGYMICVAMVAASEDPKINMDDYESVEGTFKCEGCVFDINGECEVKYTTIHFFLLMRNAGM